MNTELAIFLGADDTANDFLPAHFLPFQEVFPDIQLRFFDQEQELIAALPEIEWLDTWHFKSTWYKLAKNLRGIITPAAGKDWVASDPRGIVPTYHGTFHGPMIAETMLGLMLHFSRKMPLMLQRQQNHIWDRNAQQSSRLLGNQRALIIGYGAIGKHCGELLGQMGMEVWGYQRKHASGVDTRTGVHYISDDKLEETLGIADHIVLLLPGGAETEGFMTQAKLRQIKPGACLYNFGRGTTIREQDLLWALNQDIIAYAGIDVTEIEPLPVSSPLWEHPSVVLLPHSSCVFEEYQALHVIELTNLATQLFR